MEIEARRNAFTSSENPLKFLIDHSKTLLANIWYIRTFHKLQTIDKKYIQFGLIIPPLIYCIKNLLFFNKYIYKYINYI